MKQRYYVRCSSTARMLDFNTYEEADKYYEKEIKRHPRWGYELFRADIIKEQTEK